MHIPLCKKERAIILALSQGTIREEVDSLRKIILRKGESQDFAAVIIAATGGAGAAALGTTGLGAAALGCAVGAAKAGDCQSGAAGAVIGEVIAEAASKSLIKDGEFSDTDEWLTRTAGTTAAIFGTSALGGDFNVASDTAQNAIDNNALWLLDYLFSAEELGNAELYPEEKEEEENQDEITEAILTAGAIAKCVTKAKGCLNILKKKPKDKSKTKGLERELKEHRQRLEDYKKNPDKVDNQGYLRNAGNNQELRQEIINDRIRRLEGQIKNFEKQIRDIKSRKKIQTPKSKVK